MLTGLAQSVAQVLLQLLEEIGEILADLLRRHLRRLSERFVVLPEEILAEDIAYLSKSFSRSCNSCSFRSPSAVTPYGFFNDASTLVALAPTMLCSVSAYA